MAIDPQVLRQTMRNWATGVTVVTSAYGEERAGATVSSFTSVSLEPPTVLVCLQKSIYVHDIVSQAGLYAVSLLGQDQEAISNRFAGFDATVTDRFEGLEIVEAPSGLPFLVGAIAWLDCRVVSSIATGTHTIFIGEVEHVQFNSESAPLVYHNRAYKHLVEPMKINP